MERSHNIYWLKQRSVAAVASVVAPSGTRERAASEPLTDQEASSTARKSVERILPASIPSLIFSVSTGNQQSGAPLQSGGVAAVLIASVRRCLTVSNICIKS